MVCLPRTGSTFIGEILTKIYRLTNLHEPFNLSDKYVPGVKNGKFVILSGTNDHDTSIDDRERLDKFLRLLSTGNKTQPLLVKLFIYDAIMPFLDRIITTLRATGFEFIIIRRKNTEQHLLSMGIAKQTGIWYRHEKTIMRPYKVVVNCKDLFWMNYDRLAFDQRINEFYINGAEIWYETAREDLANYTGKPTDFDVPSMIMRIPDPYSQISNADEVRETIRGLL